jgi:CheY-like chemotaxis protein
MKTVLIIDDDPEFLENLSGVLKAAAYRVLQAADGKTALALIEQFQGGSVDLMIVDLCLPDQINGLDIILAATRRKLPVKIIAASAVFDQMYLDMATEFGANAAIRKPGNGDIATLWLDTVQRLVGDATAVPVSPNPLVVLADDEAVVRGMVRSLLHKAGYQVLEAEDGAAALALIEKIGGALDLLITDYMMPNLDGRELVRAMREKYPHIPVVYISGYVEDTGGETLDDPANRCAFVQKPFKSRALMDVVRRMMPVR